MVTHALWFLPPEAAADASGQGREQVSESKGAGRVKHSGAPCRAGNAPRPPRKVGQKIDHTQGADGAESDKRGAHIGARHKPKHWPTGSSHAYHNHTTAVHTRTIGLRSWLGQAILPLQGSISTVPSIPTQNSSTPCGPASHPRSTHSPQSCRAGANPCTGQPRVDP